MTELINHPITGKYKKLSSGGKGKGKLKLMFSTQRVQDDTLDLDTVKTKLDEGKYETLEMWKADIDKVFNTSLPSHLDDKPNMREFRKGAVQYILEEKLRNLETADMNSWAEKIIKIRRKMQSLAEDPPVYVQKCIPSLCNIKSFNEMNVLTQHEIDCFIQASEKLYSEQHHRNMLNIIHDEEPNLEIKQDNVILDINRLRLTTIYKLIEYMKDALEKQGDHYPE
ncbi:hypothetical protein TVAG_135000 [Trichomonas vaginalis G3]|uniref:NET domain-containing protein n=1 Tax=Trichomonas vaginalis (strain ATCC PRA-98 / G3) TaxID=412133 RepID=A2FKI1_TRIV3|nr:chromatin remodeling [Trichomonas vaginalis G3]EAX94593.1 hypothetical protein TVAG_135000 [Trichomonas vaginalis G3]KAI5542793.1 chromatin remodeling [Trichomonas vaginalis G3]|eukprot:XP_001307523.1 hypothetical protein [Trichomonas vaginalis G3]